MPGQASEVDGVIRDALAAEEPLLKAYEAGRLRDVMYGNPITQLLIRFLSEESEKAQMDLLDVDPLDSKRIVVLQIKGQAIGALHEALTRALEAGDVEAESYDVEVGRDVPRESGTIR